MRGQPRRRKPEAGELPDFGAISLGDNPVVTMRVLGMLKAGHSVRHIVEVGRYHGSWTGADVDRILKANRTTIPEEPDPRPFSTRPTSAHTVALPARQVTVVHHICQGMTNSEIAVALDLPLNTVKSHVSEILAACMCRDRVALVVAVLTGRLVPVTKDEQ